MLRDPDETNKQADEIYILNGERRRLVKLVFSQSIDDDEFSIG